MLPHVGKRAIGQRGLRIARAYSSLSQTALNQKWIDIWKEHPPRRAREGKPVKDKFYALSMFPYPSGLLHMGHVRVYTISDALSRYRRMAGYDVVHPMGWDAFGLPAENAAIERGADPAEWTYGNIVKMREQLVQMQAEFDWEREVITCSPEYYKWTQKLFLMLHEAGLAYRKAATVNWDPVEQTVLANEQVDSEGRSWRSGALVEQRKLEQWFLGITQFAPQLLDDLKTLEEWPGKVKTMQANWVGASEGAEIKLPMENAEPITVFTTRPDTLHGVQYVALALDHPIVRDAALSDADLRSFLDSASELPEDTKRGYMLKGVHAANPLSPSQFDLPVFAAPYVLSDYGSGAVMGVPAHDERDYAFLAENLPGVRPKQVVFPESGDAELPYTDRGGLLAEPSSKYAGMEATAGGKAIVEDLERTGLARATTQLRLRDWLISRQRFWGAPIPMVHCGSCGIVPVPDEQLPVLLPAGLNGPLANSEEFLKTKCPSCGGDAHRDSDTMDTFMDSSWYFFRFLDAHNDKQIFDPAKASAFLPVDLYIGGVEHAILHLLYLRFISKFLYSKGAWKAGDGTGEAIRRLVTQGMVHGKTMTDPDTGKFLKPDELDLSNPSAPVVKATGKPASISFEKMSKSKHNGVNPTHVISRHGADAIRAHMLFLAPVEDVLLWDETKIVGIHRWLGRVGALTENVARRIEEDRTATTTPIDISKLSSQGKTAWAGVQEYIARVTTTLQSGLSMNTLVSDYMKVTRIIADAEKDNTLPTAVLFKVTQDLLKIISPVVPANAEENWATLLKSQEREWTSIFAEDWPEAAEIVAADATTVQVVVNGRRRAAVEVSASSAEDEAVLMDAVRATDAAKFLDGKTIKKIVIPKGKKTISIVVV